MRLRLEIEQAKPHFEKTAALTVKLTCVNTASARVRPGDATLLIVRDVDVDTETDALLMHSKIRWAQS